MSERSSAGGAGTREVAYRVFAAEYDDADFSYSESDEERAPNYVITPTGARINRLFVVGVLTEVEPVNEEMVRGRVVDPTGAFVVYAGQYQPDALAFLERADPPAFVAVTGKARTFEPDDGDRIYTSVRPESISTVDASTRDRWTVQAAERTVERVGAMAGALASDRRGQDLRAALRESGVDEGLAAGIPLAIDHYGTTPTYLAGVRDLAVDALRVVAGDVDEVGGLDSAPDAQGGVDPDDLASLTLPEATGAATAASTTDTEATDTETETMETEMADTETDATDRERPAEPAPADGTAAPDDQAPEIRAGEATAGSTAGRGDDADADAPDADGAEDAAVEPEGTAKTSDEPSGPGREDIPGGEEDAEDDPLGDFEVENYDLDEDERREVEATYGTEFETGSEVDEPGAAGIEAGGAGTADATAEGPDESEPPTGDAPAESTAGADAEPATREDGAPADDAASAGDGSEAGGDGDVDLQDAAVAAMRDLDDGDGADRDAVVEAVVEEHGVERAAVEDAIQDALMGGRCYEPDEGRLTAI